MILSSEDEEVESSSRLILLTGQQTHEMTSVYCHEIYGSLSFILMDVHEFINHLLVERIRSFSCRSMRSICHC